MLAFIKEFIMGIYYRNPDIPLVLIIFVTPLVVTFIYDKTDWKKVSIFLKIVGRYSVVLVGHLFNTTLRHIKEYTLNFRQFSRAVQVRMREYQG